MEESPKGHSPAEKARRMHEESVMMANDPETAAEASSPADFGNNQLYYGSIPVHLVTAPGSTVAYEHGQWSALNDEAAVATVLSRADPIGPDGTIVVPAIPALDFGMTGNPSDANSWPEFLRNPLIKVPEPTEGEPLAFASGVWLAYCLELC